MVDIAAEQAAVTAAELDLEKVIDRLVEMIVSANSLSSAKAIVPLANVALLAARSVVASLRRTDITWRRKSLIFVLDALGPPDEPAVIQELEWLAEEDDDEDVRDHAQYVLDDMRRRERLEAEAEL
jgi:hypothetical protein